MKHQKALVYFIAGSILALTVFSIAFSEFRSMNDAQGFSQLWILGYEKKAIDYVYDLNSSNSFSGKFFVGARNKLGRNANYSLRVKFCSESAFLPDNANSRTSPVHSLYQFEFSLPDNGTWETPLTLTISQSAFYSVQRNVLNLTNISINGSAISGLNLILTRSIETDGYPFLIFFELWVYEEPLQESSYHNRFVSLWLNLQP